MDPSLRLLSVSCFLQLYSVSFANPALSTTFRIPIPVPTWHSGSSWPNYRMIYVTFASSPSPSPGQATSTNYTGTRPRENLPRRTNQTFEITTPSSVSWSTTTPLDSAHYIPPVKPVYQCFYHENLLAYCQVLGYCPKPLVRSQQTLMDNSTYYGYPCRINPTRIRYSINSGIATFGFVDLLKQKRNESGLLFICHFSTTDPPYNERVFVCAAPVRCRSPSNDFGSCSGGLPWFGTWIGDLNRGLSGTVIQEAVSQK